MNRTKIESHILELTNKHQILNRQIDHMESTGSYDDADIQYFKKKRLALRDEIEENKASLAKFEE